MRRIVLALVAVVIVGGMGTNLAHAQNITQNVGNYTVLKGETVTGNIDLNVGNVTVNGTVDGTVDVNVGNVVVSGLVKGNVHVGTGNIHAASTGHIDGTKSVGIGNAAAGQIPGTISSASHWASLLPGGTAAWGWFDRGWGNFGWVSKFLGRLFINLVVPAVMILLFPRMIRDIVHGMTETPVRAAAVGCLTLVAWVVAMIGLAVIIIGIPLTLLLALAGAVAALMANGAVVWLVGRRLIQASWWHEELEWYWVVVLGGIVVSLLETIPVIGSLAELAVMVVGIGAIVESRVSFLAPPPSGGPNLP